MKIPSKKSLQSLALFLVLVLPVLSIATVWQLNHNKYQRSDAGEFMSDSQETYLKLKTEGLFASIDRAYITRGLRPILHPYLVSPLLLLTGGNTLKAFAIYHLAIYILFLAFIFLICRIYLGLFPSAVVTNFMGSLSFVITDFSIFKSELSFLSFATGTLYYFIKSNYLKSHRNSILFAVFLGLAFCTRPVVSTLTLLPLSLLLLYFSNQKNNISRHDLWLTLPVAILTLVLLFIPAVIFNTNLNFGGAILALAIVLPLLLLPEHLARKKRLKLNKTYLKSFKVVFCILAIWYAPHANRLLDWVYLSNFSDVAVNHGGRAPSIAGYFKFLALIIDDLGTNLVLLVLGFAAFSIFCIAGRNKVKKGILTHKFVLLSGLILAAIPVVVSSLTYNGDPRYYQICAVSILLILLIISLSPKIPQYPLRLAFFMLITIAQLLSFHGSATLRVNENLHPIISRTLGGIPKVEKQTDIARQLFDKLEKTGYLPETGSNNTELGIATIAVHGFSDDANEQWALTIIGREKNRKWRFTRQNAVLNKKKNIEYFLAYAVKEKFHHFLIGPVAKNFKPHPNSMIKNLNAWVKRMKRRHGFKHSSILSLKDPVHGPVQTVLFAY